MEIFPIAIGLEKYAIGIHRLLLCGQSIDERAYPFIDFNFDIIIYIFIMIFPSIFSDRSIYDFSVYLINNRKS